MLVQKTRRKNSEEEKEDEEKKLQDYVHPDNLQKNYYFTKNIARHMITCHCY